MDLRLGPFWWAVQPCGGGSRRPPGGGLHYRRVLEPERAPLAWPSLGQPLPIAVQSSSPDRSHERLQQAAAHAGLNGWALVTLADGFDSNGEPIHWEEYQHLDGREAQVWPDGSCSDAELRQLLEAKVAQAQAPCPSRLLQVAATMARWISGLLR